MLKTIGFVIAYTVSGASGVVDSKSADIPTMWPTMTDCLSRKAAIDAHAAGTYPEKPFHTSCQPVTVPTDYMKQTKRRGGL